MGMPSNHRDGPTSHKKSTYMYMYSTHAVLPYKYSIYTCMCRLPKRQREVAQWPAPPSFPCLDSFDVVMLSTLPPSFL